MRSGKWLCNFLAVQLPESEYEELRDVAARQRRSMADCIREGIRLFLGRSQTRGADIDEIAGKFRPLSTKELKPHDQWVAEAIVQSKSGNQDTGDK